ncbi:hypothetical protein TWF696_009172 [Orbilia brochopaga]|uniref:Uncharacterized protein n=1 Tax=Orbilia brochopaga TaxID=3140254 RepID=A0AAV9UF10_9PEZI
MSSHRDHHHSRSSRRRSRSPTDESHSPSRRHRDRDRDGGRDRDRDNDRKRHHDRDHDSHRHRHRTSASPKPAPLTVAPVLLPSNAKPLDYEVSLPAYFPLFAKYLDVQKHVDVLDLDLRDVRDRFKRFVGRWNMGELAAGWYDKSYKAQIDSDATLLKWDDYLKSRDERKHRPRRDHSRDRDRDRDSEKSRDKHRDKRPRDGDRDRDRDRHHRRHSRHSDRDRDRDRSHGRHEKGSRDLKKRDDHDSELLEQAEARIRNMTNEELERALRKLDGDSTPSAGASEDVEMADGNDSDDSEIIGPSLPDSIPKSTAGAKAPTTQDLELQRELDEEEAELHRADLRFRRKKEHKLEKERLDELAPRAEPGSRERQLEKKRETAAANRAFADAKTADVEEVGEGTLMGGDDSFQQQKAAMERKKNERELRREALLRARKAEREERLQVHKQKEEQTMKMLRALAEKFR